MCRGRLKLKKPGGGVQGRGPPERTLGETHTHALVRSLEYISGDSFARSKGVACVPPPFCHGCRSSFLRAPGSHLRSSAPEL